MAGSFNLVIPVDTSTFHRSLVFTDGAAIYQADIRSVTAVLSAYPLKTIDVSAAAYTGLRFLTMDVADRIVFFTTNDLEIHSFNIDMLNPIVDHVVSSTSTITSKLVISSHSQSVSIKIHDIRYYDSIIALLNKKLFYTLPHSGCFVIRFVVNVSARLSVHDRQISFKLGVRYGG